MKVSTLATILSFMWIALGVWQLIVGNEAWFFVGAGVFFTGIAQITQVLEKRNE